MIIETSYGDLWFEIGRNGEHIPMYSDRTCERAAIEAFLRGDYGSLTVDEIEFMREAAQDAGIRL